MKKKVVRVKIRNAYDVVGDALETAVERACNRCDKYNEASLTEGQRDILTREFPDSFWMALEDAGIEVK